MRLELEREQAPVVRLSGEDKAASGAAAEAETAVARHFSSIEAFTPEAWDTVDRRRSDGSFPPDPPRVAKDARERLRPDRQSFLGLRLELAKTSVTCNPICPGTVPSLPSSTGSPQSRRSAVRAPRSPSAIISPPATRQGASCRSRTSALSSPSSAVRTATTSPELPCRSTAAGWRVERLGRSAERRRKLDEGRGRHHPFVRYGRANAMTTAASGIRSIRQIASIRAAESSDGHPCSASCSSFSSRSASLSGRSGPPRASAT